MPANLQEALPFILLALAFLIALWVIFRASRRTKVIGETQGDVLDEGADPASRNQALIDAKPAAVEDTGVPMAATVAEEIENPEPSPAPAATPAAAPQGSDDLRRIKGLGPKLVTILAEQGVTSFAQIASWSEADIERVDATLGRFSGRITRDQWVEQAKLLAAGDESGFAKAFGNNG
ncbi:MAG: helix-hairpin-helix domain-containing protein [Pseudomonadota bacterium]